jgi:hypothetical protein
MDDGGGEVDDRFETAVSLVASHCYAFEFFQFAEEVLDQVAPFVNVHVDIERLGTPGMLRDYNFRLAFVHVFDDPVGIKGIVGDQATKFDVFDQGRDADGVKTMAGKQDEPHQIPKCIGLREDFGGPAALRLADGLIFGPPFAPCAWR